jgi:hypothetical protein
MWVLSKNEFLFNESLIDQDFRETHLFVEFNRSTISREVQNGLKGLTCSDYEFW